MTLITNGFSLNGLEDTTFSAARTEVRTGLVDGGVAGTEVLIKGGEAV
jgi:hypothetical protein